MARRRSAIPDAVAFLGELDSFAIEVDGWIYEQKAKRGKILCASPDGREMYILIAKDCEEGSGRGRHSNDRLLAATSLHERFVRREADKFFNLRIPVTKKPEYVGRLVTIRYISDKVEDDDMDPEIEYEEEGEDMLGPEEELPDLDMQRFPDEEEDDDEDDDEDDLNEYDIGGEASPPTVVYEHHFESDVHLYHLGSTQYVIPSGDWFITERGIEG